MIDWAHSGATILAAFLASLVEFVEALTIVLAVGTVRGWRPALTGAAAGTALLVTLVLAFGPVLGRIPIAWLQVVVGVLLLLFGMRWLRKAVLRAAGIIALHDEAAAFAEKARLLREAGSTHGPWDTVALITSFKAVVLEGLEVIFIVIAIGAAGNALAPASLGAVAAFLVVIMLGLLLHRPLAKVPENSLKFAVGILLSAFGIFWVGEGVGFEWPGEDLALFALIAGFLAAALLAVGLARRIVGAGLTSQPSNF
ncbi:MAG: COG4280 domain-containing protein [Kiloniellaceae bacterium]